MRIFQKGRDIEFNIEMMAMDLNDMRISEAAWGGNMFSNTL